MATAGEYDLAAQVRHVVCQIDEGPIHTRKRQYQVAIANHVECRDRDLCAVKRRQQFPISVDVAIPVQTAAKPRTLEFADVKIKVRFRQPVRKGGGKWPVRKPPAVARYHAHRVTGESFT